MEVVRLKVRADGVAPALNSWLIGGDEFGSYGFSVMDNRKLLTFTDRSEWRAWLRSHYSESPEAWLVIYKKGAPQRSLSLDEAIEEALCFGWIDGKLKSLDIEKYSLRFTPRRASSIWAISNIRRVERLISEGQMTEAGLAKIAEARQSGQWDAAIARERTDVIPSDLEKALRRRKGAIAAYRNLTNSRKKQLLYWLFNAKRAETRKKRIEAIVSEVAN
jgi:uncharacterized protein YdeI (YjbR/CyaY-like superfamily)